MGSSLSKSTKTRGPVVRSTCWSTVCVATTRVTCGLMFTRCLSTKPPIQFRTRFVYIGRQYLQATSAVTTIYKFNLAWKLQLCWLWSESLCPMETEEPKRDQKCTGNVMTKTPCFNTSFHFQQQREVPRKSLWFTTAPTRSFPMHANHARSVNLTFHATSRSMTVDGGQSHDNERVSSNQKWQLTGRIICPSPVTVIYHSNNFTAGSVSFPANTSNLFKRLSWKIGERCESIGSSGPISTRTEFQHLSTAEVSQLKREIAAKALARTAGRLRRS